MLERLIPQRGSERAGDPTYSGSFYSLPGGFGMTQAAYTNANGVESALMNAASWACIRIIVDALARTPIKAVRETRGVREPVEPCPRILARPSGIVAVDVWRAQLGFSVTTDGNVFGKIADYDHLGKPTQIELLDPATVTDRKVEGGIPRVSVDHKPETLYPFGDIWHLPGDMVMPGTPFAISPLTYANRVVGTSLAAQDFSFNFFSDGGHPPIALVSDHELLEAEAQDLKRKMVNATRGTREPLVFGSGLNLQELHLDPHETQFIDLMRFCVEQACRFWGVPPSMVFASVSGQSLTYANVTQADLGFLKQTLEGKFVRLETAFTDLLPGNNYTAPSVPNMIALCDRNAVLKADVDTRYKTHLVSLEGRFKTVNEIRAEEGDPPFEGDEYDEPGVPPFKPTPDPNAVDVNGNAMQKTPPPFKATKPAPKQPPA